VLPLSVVLDLFLALVIVVWPLRQPLLRARRRPLPAVDPPPGADRAPAGWARSIRRSVTVAGVLLAALPTLAGVGADPAAADPTAPAQQGVHIKIVVIGDSYTSGEGADPSTYAAATVRGSRGQLTRVIDPAHLSSNAPAQQAIEALRAEHPNATFEVKYVAVSGATRESMEKPSGAPPFQHPPQLSEIKDANIVIVGVGGDDIGGKDANGNVIGFSTWIKSVLGANLSPGGESAAVVRWQQIMNHLRDGSDKGYVAKQTELYKKIVDAIDKNGTIITLGYPQILTDHPGGLVSDRLARLSNQLAATINAANAIATERAQGQTGPHLNFVDLSNALLGHQLGDPQPGVHGLEVTNQQGSYHPNPLGMQIIAQLLRPAIGSAINWEQRRQSPPPAGSGQPPATPPARVPDKPNPGRQTGPRPPTQQRARPAQPNGRHGPAALPPATTGDQPRPGSGTRPGGSRPDNGRPSTQTGPSRGRSGSLLPLPLGNGQRGPARQRTASLEPPNRPGSGGSSGGGTQSDAPSGGTQPGGTQSGGTQSGGTQSGGTQSGGTQSGGAGSGGASSGGASSGGAQSGGASSGSGRSGGAQPGGNPAPFGGGPAVGAPLGGGPADAAGLPFGGPGISPQGSFGTPPQSTSGSPDLPGGLGQPQPLGGSGRPLPPPPAGGTGQSSSGTDQSGSVTDTNQPAPPPPADQPPAPPADQPAPPVDQPAPPVVQPAPPVVQPAPPVDQPAPPVAPPAPPAPPPAPPAFDPNQPVLNNPNLPPVPAAPAVDQPGPPPAIVDLGSPPSDLGSSTSVADLGSGFDSGGDSGGGGGEG
jgi:hypothetical protein